MRVKQYASKIEVWYGSRIVELIARIPGVHVHIDYRHIIKSLVRKPGAFENYKYNVHLFPSSHFREAYDDLKEHSPKKATKEYLHILELAAEYSETEVDLALKNILDLNTKVTLLQVMELITQPQAASVCDVHIDEPSLSKYDNLIGKIS